MHRGTTNPSPHNIISQCCTPIHTKAHLSIWQQMNHHCTLPVHPRPAEHLAEPAAVRSWLVDPQPTNETESGGGRERKRRHRAATPAAIINLSPRGRRAAPVSQSGRSRRPSKPRPLARDALILGYKTRRRPNSHHHLSDIELKPPLQ